jgi:hypothetical protein
LFIITSNSALYTVITAIEMEFNKIRINQLVTGISALFISGSQTIPEEEYELL